MSEKKKNDCYRDLTSDCQFSLTLGTRRLPFTMSYDPIHLQEATINA